MTTRGAPWDVLAGPDRLRRLPPLSLARRGQPERGHLLAVANQQDVSDQHRVVPGLALDRRETRELGEPLGSRGHQRKLTVAERNMREPGVSGHEGSSAATDPEPGEKDREDDRETEDRPRSPRRSRTP